MADIRTVGALSDIQSQQESASDQVSAVVKATARLASAKLIPVSAIPEQNSILHAVLAVRSSPQASNKELLKMLHRLGEKVRPFANLVVRVWLLSPPESVVESMGSMLKEIFSMHRQLLHENAAKELVIRWNGPDVDDCDALLRAVQKKKGYDFIRRSVNVKNMLAGTVIARHRATRSHRTSLFR